MSSRITDGIQTKPCPFCGGRYLDMTSRRHYENFNTELGTFTIACRTCKRVDFTNVPLKEMGYVQAMFEAVAEWNRRVPA